MTTTSGASKETQTTSIPIITGEESPMEELRLCVLGTVQVRWKYLHDLKGKILDLESKVTFLNLQHDRAMFYVKKEVAETIAYREKYEATLRELEKQKCDTAHAEERGCFLEKKLQEMKMELSEMGVALIEERNNHSQSREYANRLLQENDTLKRRVDQLETVQSETRTQLGTYVGEARTPMSPVSVPSSPREQRQHGNPNTPRLFPETRETASDVDEEEQSMSPTLFNYVEEMRLQEMEYYRHGRRNSESSSTTDCSGDPLCHSDSD